MKPFRLCLLATASSVALIGGAAAQPPAPYAVNWAGPYIGLNLGAAWNNAKFSDLGTPGVPGSFFLFPPANNPLWSPNSAGVTLGGQAGYNWQTGMWVYGVEGDLNWTGNKSSAALTAPGGQPVVAATNMDWTGTVRGRVGVAVSQFLLYGTGGVAFAHFADNWGNAATNGSEFSSSYTRTGWTAGGGVEYMLAQHWTVRVEAQYADFGTNTITVVIPGGTYQSSFQHTVTTARAALNWKW